MVTIDDSMVRQVGTKKRKNRRHRNRSLLSEERKSARGCHRPENSPPSNNYAKTCHPIRRPKNRYFLWNRYIYYERTLYQNTQNYCLQTMLTMSYEYSVTCISETVHLLSSLFQVTLGKRIGFYRLREELGSGNFSQVKMGLHSLTRDKVHFGTDGCLDCHLPWQRYRHVWAVLLPASLTGCHQDY